MRPLDKEHNQRARRHLAEQGIEMTPAELEQERKAAYETIRTELRKAGFKNVPDSDEELFLLIQKVYREKEKRDG